MSTRRTIMSLGTVGFLFCLGALLLKTRELVRPQDELAVSKALPSLARDAEQLQEVLAPLAVEVSVAPGQIEVSFSGDTLFFAYDDSSLMPDAQRKLRLLAEAIADRYESCHILVVGHTDDRGDPGYNKLLGKRRADMVVDFLAASGLDPEEIRSMSMGEGAPIAANDAERGRALNRRVEIQVRPLGNRRNARLEPWMDAFMEVLKNHPIFVVCGALSSLMTVFTWLSGIFPGAERNGIARR